MVWFGFFTRDVKVWLTWQELVTRGGDEVGNIAEIAVWLFDWFLMRHCGLAGTTNIWYLV